MSNDKCRMINRQESSSCFFLLVDDDRIVKREDRMAGKEILMDAVGNGISSGILDSFFIGLTSSSNNKFFLFEIQIVFHIPYS